MRRLPWHVSVRADRKAVLTALGVALGVAFAFVSFAVPDGLATETVSQDGPLANQDLAVSRPDFVPFALAELDARGATGFLLVSGSLSDGRPVTLAAMDGPLAPAVEPGTARPGRTFRVEGGAENVSIDVPASRSWRLGERAEGPHLGSDWLMVAPQEARELEAGFAGGRVSYAIVPAEASRDVAALRERGFVVSPVPGVEPFFVDSTREVARDLALVVAFSSVLVALFAYEFLRSEVREKRREIGVWRALGMRANDVLALLLARAAAIALGGTLVGFGLALVAIQGAARATGSAIFVFSLAPWLVAALVLAFIGASVVGGFVPAWQASRGLIRDQLEAAP